MAQIIVLTTEAKDELKKLLFEAVNNDPDNDMLHALYSDVVNTKR